MERKIISDTRFDFGNVREYHRGFVSVRPRAKYEQLLRSYSQFRQAANALTAYCETTDRTLFHADELSAFYAKNVRRDYRVFIVVTATREVMVLTKDRLGGSSVIEYLRREGRAAFAILCLEHKTRPLFRRGYSIFAVASYADGINNNR